MPTGDIIYNLSGDDEVGDGWFRIVIDYIKNTKLDYKNELFCIYGDYEVIYKDSSSLRISNYAVHTHPYDALSLSLRGKISNRSACYSKQILEKFVNVSQGRSHIAELIQDRQLQAFSKYNYYIPHVGNKYYSDLGVSSKMSRETLLERVNIRPYALEQFSKIGIPITSSDRYFMLAQKYKLSYKLDRNVRNYFSKSIYNILGINLKYFSLIDFLKMYVKRISRKIQKYKKS